MPKSKASESHRLNKYVLENSDVQSTDGKILFCNVCSKKVSADQKSQVDQHLASASHKEMQERYRQQPRPLQPFISLVNHQTEFNKDLCKMLVACDIPINKVSNPNLVSFLEKYTKFRVPSHTSLRQKALNDLYDETMQGIRKKTAGQFL